MPVQQPPFQPLTTGRTIIRLRSTAHPAQFDRHLKSSINQDASAGPGDNLLVHQYTGAIKGYAGTFTPAVLDQIKQHPDVAAIEPDYIGHIDSNTAGLMQQESPPSWGLVRISERKDDLSKPYMYPSSSGTGIVAFVMDTGIDITHSDFEGRATWGKTFVENEPDQDDNGHGTHIAGTIAGTKFGIAKHTSLVAVKVCDGDGNCATSDVIAGLNWIIKQAKPMKTVVNISLGLLPSDTLDELVNAAVSAGIHVNVSGGNDNADACENSPRRAKFAFAVGASDQLDRKAKFSNYGLCVKVFAPGVDIVSAAPGNGEQVMSGTSMASPHVCGVAALYLAENKYTSIVELHKDLVERSTRGIVQNTPANTTTNLIYSLAQYGEPSPTPSSSSNPAPVSGSGQNQRVDPGQTIMPIVGPSDA